MNDEEDADVEQELGSSEADIENPESSKPARVLVFTTSLLLGLLAVCKAMSKQWKQLFILPFESPFKINSHWWKIIKM